MGRLLFALFLSLCGTALFASAPAQAELDICNETDSKRSVAIGYRDDGVWTSEGWWVIEPGDCKRVVGGDLKKRYYYYRATAKGSEFEGEGFFFCTQSDPFTIVGDENCKERGYLRENFRELDTGETAKSFKLTLTASRPSKVTDNGPKAADTSQMASSQSSLQTASGGAAPGTYGEPISLTAKMIGCFEEGDWEYCEIRADEWTYTIGRDQRTPTSIFDMMWGIPSDTTVMVAGDLVEYTGSDAFITLRELSWEAVAHADNGADNGQDTNTISTFVSPGTHGEPVTFSGTFDGCETAGDFTYCAVTSDNFPYLLLRDDRTSDDWFQALSQVDIGVPITVEADITANGDTVVEVIPRTISWGYETALSSGGWASLINGSWGFPEDTSTSISFSDGNYVELDEYGNITEQGQYEFGGQCDGRDADLRIYYLGMPNDPMCYSIGELDWGVLTLWHFGAPYELRYVRLN